MIGGAFQSMIHRHTDTQTQSTEEVRPEDEEVNRAQSKEMFLNVYTAAERTQTRLKHEVHVILKHLCHLSCLQIHKTTKNCWNWNSLASTDN